MFNILPEDSRLTTFPIIRPELFELYQQATRCYWTVEEIPLSTDAIDYETKLTPPEQHFVKHILAFFAASDGIININILERFKADVPILEAGYFYDYQVMMENVHAHTYSLLLDTIIPSQAERDMLLNAIKTMPIITEISEFIFRCINSDASFADRVLRMACIEGILFTGCFCAIYWLASRGLMPGLSLSNELISRDEGLHARFALHLYNMIDPDHKLERTEIVTIFTEAVDLSKKFIRTALPTRLPEMNAELMTEYIQCYADNLLTLIHQEPIYNSKNPFGFMEQINLTNRTNFFERRVSEYSKTQTTEEEYLFDVEI